MVFAGVQNIPDHNIGSTGTDDAFTLGIIQGRQNAGAKTMTERKVKLDRANKSILLRALGDVYYGQRARGGSTEVTGRLILRVNDLPAGGKLTLSAAEYRLAKAALNQLRTQRLAEGGYTDAVDDALTRLLHAHTPLFIW